MKGRKVYESLLCICADCGKESTTKVVDEGIGPYEYCGAYFVNTDYQVVSVCCEADCYAHCGGLLTMSDMKEDCPDFD
jgi:hypothetical protein